jgi:VWFA-related protein
LNRMSRACLVVSLSLPILAYTQQGAPPAPAAQARTVPATGAAQGSIKLDVVVTDQSGKPVSGLEAKDFTLWDNNQPAKILSLNASEGTDLRHTPPVEVILLIDTVNQDFKYVAFMRQEIVKFLGRNGGHLAQPVSLLVLTNLGVDALVQRSTDGNAMAAEVMKLDNRLRSVGSSGGVNGAIERFYSSLKMIAAIAQSESGKPGKKLLVWVGPGWPMLDSVNVQVSANAQHENFKTIVGLSAVLRDARVSVYSISSNESGVGATVYRSFLKGVKSAGKSSPDNLALKVLAVQSGGRVLGPNNDIAAQIDSCVEDARSFYTLSFDPPRADHADEYHDLKVVIGKPGLTARTNTGYYNQP